MQLNLSKIDLGVVVLYILATVGIAWWARKHQKSTEDYYLAGRSMHWFVVSVSLFATLFSTISFVSVPGEAYKNGALFFLNSPAYVIGLPVAIALFLPFFFQQKTFTAYEYLEIRFDVKVRAVGSGIFLIARCLYAATVLYAASKLFAAFVVPETSGEVSETTIILLVGVFSILYTTVGGMRAVMLTDVFQTMILFLGLFGVGFTLMKHCDFDFVGVYQFANDHNHAFGAVATREFYSLDPHVRYTFWLVLLGVFVYPLVNVGTDQLTVQRLLAGKGYREAKKALWVKAFLGLAVMGVLYFLGLALYQYYNAGRIQLPADVTPDKVLGYFIATELSAPFPGLLVAALLAALMSTVDSTINSLAAVTNVDFIDRFHLLPDGATDRVFTAKILTIAWGAVILALACCLSIAGEKVESTVLEVAILWGMLWLVLLAVFLSGVLTKWVTAKAAFWGALAGAATNLTLPWFLYYGTPADERISFAWMGIPGFLVTGLMCVVVSLLWPCEKPADTSDKTR